MLTSGRRRGGQVGTGVGIRSVQLTLGRFKSALAIAVRRQLIVRNVAQYTQIPREARRKATATAALRMPWNDTEVKQFLASPRHHRLYAPVLLALIGMRPAEVWVRASRRTRPTLENRSTPAGHLQTDEDRQRTKGSTIRRSTWLSNIPRHIRCTRRDSECLGGSCRS